jgi:CRISPR-associated Cas5-like protein
MDFLLLRFDAPLMSFGGVMVDQYGPTDRFPGQSMRWVITTGIWKLSGTYRPGLNMPPVGM